MRRAAPVGAKGRPFFLIVKKLGKTVGLKTTGVGQNRPPPVDKSVQAAGLADDLHAGLQIKVVGVGKNDFSSQRANFLKQKCFHASSGGHRRKGGRLKNPVRRFHPSSAGGRNSVDRLYRKSCGCTSNGQTHFKPFCKASSNFLTPTTSISNFLVTPLALVSGTKIRLKPIFWASAIRASTCPTPRISP